MKIKFLLVIAAFLMHAVSAAAQSPTEFSTKDLFSIYDKSKNCDDVNFLSAPEAQGCNGAQVTPILFNSTGRIVVSGTDNTPGVKYRYPRAGTAPDGTVLDALVTVVGYTNNQDSDPTNFPNADLPGDSPSPGFDRNLQPSIGQANNHIVAAPWTGSITYNIQFVLTGTNTPKAITVAATTIDNDGSGQCGGLKESVTYSTALNQVLTTATTAQVLSNNTITAGSTAIQTNIGVGPDYASAALYINVSEFNWTYSFTTAGNCAVGGTSEVRYGSLNLDCQINFGRNFVSSGTVFNDLDGLANSTVDGTGIATPGGTQLFANLLDASNNVTATSAVAANGTYTFPTFSTGSYKIQISTVQGVVGNPAPSTTLPTGWVNTGENVGAGAGNDGTINGLLPITFANDVIINADFGIEQRPSANTNAAPSQTNPGGTNRATVPPATFSASDLSGGFVSNIRITAFPSNATSLTIGTATYYANAGAVPVVCPTATCGAFPSGGVTTPTGTNGNPTQIVQVDPINGAVTVAISYVAIDNANVESSSAATASVPFSTVSLSGTVFNDVNGLNDTPAPTVNGTGTNAGGLFVNLLDSGNNVVATTGVAADGTYSLNGLNSGNYTVQISTVQGTIGNASPAAILPTGWVSTGEHFGAGAGSDGTVNSLLPVTVSAVSVSNVNFGIEQRPTAANTTAPSQTNPGGTNNATVPPSTFATSDTAAVSSIRITAFPSNATTVTINGTQYNSQNFPGGGVTIPIGVGNVPSQVIQVDPINGAVTVAIRYVAIDNAGVASSPDASAATASVPFTLAPSAARGTISGTLSLGGNPLPNTLVVLFETTSASRVFTRTDDRGTYSFNDKEVGRTYIVQPLSSKYSFASTSRVVNLNDDVAGINFDSIAKAYRPKNDFDGDGKTDIAVFRPSEGNWYVLKSSDGKVSVFNFGSETDVPVPADFDGDGKTDYAVFRPTEGKWYIWQSKTQDLRVENFGVADDKLVPADFDGDGKSDIAVYRDGNWLVRRSSDNSFESKNFGLNADIPITQDFDGDGKIDFSVYRPSDKNWYSLRSSNDGFSVENFGLSTDVPVAGDFDGDGFADAAQFRNGNWYVLNSTVGFESFQLGSGRDKSMVGDFDGDGRTDAVTFQKGIWSIHYSDDGILRKVRFGLATDILLK